jgi:hypothetical protein
MGNTLRQRFGPLPVWAWGLILVILLAVFLSYRKRQAAAAAAAAAAQQGATSSNLGTTPVSNLTTVAQPMPVQLGDTFVSVPQSVNQTVTGNPLADETPAYALQEAALPARTLAVLPNAPGPPMTAAGWAALKKAVAEGGGPYLTAMNNASKQAYWGPPVQAA